MERAWSLRTPTTSITARGLKRVMTPGSARRRTERSALAATSARWARAWTDSAAQRVAEPARAVREPAGRAATCGGPTIPIPAQTAIHATEPGHARGRAVNHARTGPN